MALSIGSLVATTKTVQIDFPGIPDFTVSLSYISRDEMAKIRKKATTVKFRPGSREQTEELNSDLFLKLYVAAAVKDWKGLTVRKLSQLMVLNDVPAAQLDTEVEYSEENALELIKNSKDFDIFVGESIGDLTNFQNASTQSATKV